MIKIVGFTLLTHLVASFHCNKFHPQLITVLDIDDPVYGYRAYMGFLAVDEQLDVDEMDAAAPAAARTLGNDVNSTRREVARRAAVET